MIINKCLVKRARILIDGVWKIVTVTVEQSKDGTIYGIINKDDAKTCINVSKRNRKINASKVSKNASNLKPSTYGVDIALIKLHPSAPLTKFNVKQTSNSNIVIGKIRGATKRLPHMLALDLIRCPICSNPMPMGGSCYRCNFTST